MIFALENSLVANSLFLDAVFRIEGTGSYRNFGLGKEN